MVHFVRRCLERSATVANQGGKPMSFAVGAGYTCVVSALVSMIILTLFGQSQKQLNFSWGASAPRKGAAALYTEARPTRGAARSCHPLDFKTQRSVTESSAAQGRAGREAAGRPRARDRLKAARAHRGKGRRVRRRAARRGSSRSRAGEGGAE